MSLTAKQRRDLLYGILAQGGDLGEIDLHAELGKAESMIAMMDAQRKTQINAKMSQISPDLPMGGTNPPPTPEMPSTGLNTLNGGEQIVSPNQMM